MHQVLQQLYSTQQKAKQFHLTGWVQNQSDGSVELEIEGENYVVNKFLNELEQGFNQFIRVDNMEVDTVQTLKGYEDFSIK